MDSKLLAEDIHDELREKILVVKFTKKDGTERTMRCTTRQDLIAETASENTPRTTSKDPYLFRVTDVDINEWRSFRLEQIISVSQDV